MNLKQFISDTLVEIVQGIEDAKSRLSGSRAMVSPRISAPRGEITPDRRPTEYIQFDVAVYAGESDTDKAGAGLVVGFLGIGASTETKDSHTSASRIQFRIPMAFPAHEMPTDRR